MLATSLIASFTLYIFIKFYNYHAAKKNRKKLLFLCFSILCLTICYFLQEVLKLSFFEKLEIAFRDLLFIICFYFFFLDILYIDERKIIFYSCVLLLFGIQLISLYDIFHRLYHDKVCETQRALVQLIF